MTLATEVRIIGNVSPEGLFAKCRELIGIPMDQPMEIERSGGWVFTLSKPGGFRAALDMFVAVNGPSITFEHDRYCAFLGTGKCYCDEREAIPCPQAINAVVRFDTGYGFKEAPFFSCCSDLHRHLTAELGKWLMDQGADWWGHDECYGEWHHATPVPVEVVR